MFSSNVCRMGRIFAKTWMFPRGEKGSSKFFSVDKSAFFLDPFGRSGKPSIVFSPF